VTDAASRTRDLRAVTAAAVVFGLAHGGVGVAVPLLALRAGYSAAEIGVLAAIAALAQLTVRLGLGWVMRRWPDWLLVAGGGLLLGLGGLILALSTSLPAFVVAQLLLGASRACFFTGSQTHVVHGSGRTARALARVNLAASAGMLVGPLVAGALSEFTPVAAISAAAVVGAVVVVPASLLDRLPPFTPPQDRPAGRLWRRPGVGAACWASATGGAWYVLVTSYVPVALEQAGQSATTIGILVTVANGATLAGTAAAGRATARWTAPGLAVGVLTAGVGIGLTAPVASSAALSGLALAASGVAVGAVLVLTPALAAESVHPGERGDVIALIGTFRSAAQFSAPLAVAGLVTLVPLAPAVAVVGAVMALPALSVGRRRADRPAP
jgi:MFS family permease